MSYVIYNKKSTRVIQTYDTLRGAKSVLTRKVNLGEIQREENAIASMKEFVENIEQKRSSINLMTGKEVVLPVNTPLCCDPSSETYWSM